MRIKGLSKYDVSDIDGKLVVRGLSRGGVRKAGRYGTYVLITDKGKAKSMSTGQLRFLLRHPELSADDVIPSIHRMRFGCDGTVKGLYEDKRQRRPRTAFRDVDDVLATVLIMKAAAAGDVGYLYRFISEHRDEALEVASAKGGCFRRDMREIMPEAEEAFVADVTNANFRMIKPLFAIYVNAIRKTYMHRLYRYRRFSDTSAERSLCCASYQPELI